MRGRMALSQFPGRCLLEAHLAFLRTASSLGLFQAKNSPGSRTSRLAVTKTLNRAQAVTQLNSAQFLRAPAGTAQQGPAVYGISPFYITGVELGQGYRTGKLVGSCERPEGLSKVFTCTFVAPEQPTVYKYSVYVCRGNKLFDSYDPFVVSDI